MKINSMRIENFRQFWKPIILDFATSSDKNVTVIHGANGAGKTSLLNAFKWCFYGQTDFDTENDFILNEAAIANAGAGDLITSSVQIKCSDAGNRYDIIRKNKYLKRSNGTISLKESDFSVDVSDESGKTVRSKMPASTIELLIPRNLQPYFFFNGERIEKIANVNEGDKIKQAIRYLTGLELIERAHKHVQKAARQIRKEGKDFKSEIHQDIYDEINLKEDEKVRIADSIRSIKQTLVSTRESIDAKNNELKKIEKAKFLADKRETLNRNIRDLKKEMEEVNSDRASTIDAYRASILSSKLINDSKQIIEENRKIGRLPYRVRDQFIKDLIESGHCMCGNPIKPNSAEEKTLQDALKEAGSDDAEEVFTRLQGLISHFDNDNDVYKQKHEALTSRYNERLLKIENIQDEITEINLKLREISQDDDKVAKLENDINELNKQAINLVEELARHDIELETIEASLKEKKDQFEELEDKREKHTLTSARYDAAQNVANALNSLNEFLTDRIRLDLSQRVNKTFQAIMRKPVEAIIDENYHLKVVKTDIDGSSQEAREQSTGEKQVTSLSFIASIIELAKEQINKKNTNFFTGGVYPLVMDSPFGALDDDYRFKVAQSVSNLADQVIIFVSNSQWSGNVKQACEDRIGKSYKLVYHTSSIKDSKLTERGYLAASDTGFEYSSIDEVKTNA